VFARSRLSAAAQAPIADGRLPSPSRRTDVLHTLLTADAVLRAWLASHHAGWLDPVMSALSLLGQAGTIWILLGAIVVLRQPRLAPMLWQIVLAILVAQIVVDHMVKPLVARGRPFDVIAGVRVLGPHPTTYSFPSGHAASAVAGAYLLSLMLARHRWAPWLLAIGIAFSRIYIGVHYPLDVAGGMLTGWAVAVVVTGGRAWYTQQSLAAPTGPQAA
jgi:undecaprenyl-diphosphatase